MGYRAYKYTFKLHAAHNLDASLSKDQAHFHTLKIILYVQNQGFFEVYQDIEETIENYLKQFEGKYLNHTPPFNNFSPTIENIGTVFYDHLKQIIAACHFNLLKLEISETPTRIFSISEEIIL